MNDVIANWGWVVAAGVLGFVLGYETCRRREVEPLRKETEDSFRAIAKAAEQPPAQIPPAPDYRVDAQGTAAQAAQPAQPAPDYKVEMR